MPTPPSPPNQWFPGPGPAPVDWSTWQARIRAAAGPPGGPGRPMAARARRLPGVVLGIVVGLGVVGTTVGGAVYAGRPTATDAPRGGSALTAPPSPLSAAPVEQVRAQVVPEPTAPPAPPPPEPSPVPAAPGARGVYPVGRLTADLVDASRPPVPRGDAAAAAGRLLRTEIRYPDARSAGPFPLVVFAHGYATSTAAYAPLLDDLAAAGYVVVAPEFPVTGTALGGDVGDREPDAQVADLSFVMSAVMDLAGGDGPLRGMVRDGPIGVVGHSDGGITAAATAFASRVRDPRVGAAVVLSGARGDFGGTWFLPESPALLAVHGDADSVNPFAASQALYASDRSGSPRYLVRVRGAGHTDAFVGARTRPALVALVDDFLRAGLGTDPDAAGRIPEDASAAGVLELLAS